MRDRTRFDHPVQAIWQAQGLARAIFVTLGLATIVAVAAANQPLRIVDLAEKFALASFIGVWVALLAMGGLFTARNWVARLDPHTAAWSFLAIWVGSAVTVSVAGTWAGRFMLAFDMSGFDFGWRIVVISTTAGLLGLGTFDNWWQSRRLQVQAQQAELAALQARIRPHFLFNTLNAAVSLVRQKPEAVEAILLNLSDLFRAALAGPQVCSLAEEIELARKYLEIESMRFGSRLTVNWRLPEPLPEVDLPRLSLQPLVENAVLHGIERRPDGGSIDIEVGATGRELAITVRNDLPATDTPRRIGHHIGVEAVRERLLRVSGGRGRLDVRTEAHRHVAQIVLPYATTS